MTVPHVRVHVPERALTTWLAARLLAVDDVRHRRPPQGRRRRGRRPRDRPPRHPARQPPRRRHVRRRRGPPVPPRDRPGRPARALLDAARGDDGRRRRSGLRDVEPLPDEARTPEAALRFVARGAPRGGLVVLVSDFRGPRDWLPAAGGRAARATRSSSSRSATRARTSCPTSATLTLVDAETGREVRVDTSSRDPARTSSPSAAAGERAHVASELRRLGVASRRPVHVRRAGCARSPTSSASRGCCS